MFYTNSYFTDRPPLLGPPPTGGSTPGLPGILKPGLFFDGYCVGAAPGPGWQFTHGGGGSDGAAWTMPAPDGKVDSPSPVAIAAAPARCFISISLDLPDLPITAATQGFRAIPANNQRSRTIRVVELSSSSTTSARRSKSLKGLSPKDF